MAKKQFLCILLALTCLLLFSCEDSRAPQDLSTVNNISYHELGIPLAEKYPDGDMARCAWDMVLYEGKLYLGSGDYDLNLGPAEIWAYDTTSSTWAKSGVLPDEEVSLFCYLYGELAVPGTDPREDWELGNYYVLHDGVWETHRVIPGGIHVFDIVEFDGMLFAGLGVLAGEYPISCSLDGGETFESIVMKKDGRPIKTDEYDTVRTYDLFAYGEKLYATFSYGSGVYELYLYDDTTHVFNYVSDWYDTVKRAKYKYARIGEKAVFEDTMFFTTGYLYRACDMTCPEKIEMPSGTLVCDIAVIDNMLYLLCGKKTEDGQFKTSVLKMSDPQSNEFEELFNFVYDVPPMSFAVCGEDFYIGMGKGTAKHEKNGMLLYVNYP